MSVFLTVTAIIGLFGVFLSGVKFANATTNQEKGIMLVMAIFCGSSPLLSALTYTLALP